MEAQATKLSNERKEEIINEVAVKYLNNVSGPEDFKKTDCSGFSNATFLLMSNNPSADRDKHSKIALRFFESTTADLALENKVF